MADILEPSVLDVIGIMLDKGQQKIPEHKVMETNLYIRYPVKKKKGERGGGWGEGCKLGNILGQQIFK